MDTLLKNNNIGKLLLYALIASVIFPCHGQEIQELQFVNQPISDILLALGEISGKSIVPDDTVRGTASYYFADTDFETALAVFLETFNMYLKKEEGVYYVSRIQTEYDAANGAISMHAEGVEISLLLRSASRAIGKTILFDALPAEPLTVHINQATPEEFLSVITRKYSDLTLEVDDHYFYIKRVPVQSSSAPGGKISGSQLQLSQQENRYTIDSGRVRFVELIDALFVEAGIEYSLLTKRDAILDGFRFKEKSFEELLRIILEQASADYAKIGDIYYIFEVTERDILKKLKTTLSLPLVHLSVQDLPNLFPPDLLSTRFYKIDTVNNSIILNGSAEEIAPIQSFIEQIDRPQKDQQYYRFDLNYIKVDELKAVLPDSLKHISIKPIPNTSSFVAMLSKQRADSLLSYLELVDKPGDLATIRLRYIKSEDLLAKLPPSISSDDVVATGDPSIIFLRGTPEKLEAMHRELEVLDRPTPQIKYHILAVQYSEGKGLNWSISVDSKVIQGDDATAFIGTIGKLLTLNFDIVSAFGYLFALNLSLDMSTNDAHILADTTLHGVSGQEIKFQNTNTFRYRELEVDEEGNQKATGVTREITAGLIFSIQGWVSGDGVISMKINATVSKRGTDTSTTTATLPPTSENVVSTEVRTRVGEPVVIGGLVRQEKVIGISKVPVLGSIPILGLLFQSRKETVENSELAIYILPHVDYGFDTEQDVAVRLERLYEKFGGEGRY